MARAVFPKLITAPLTKGPRRKSRQAERRLNGFERLEDRRVLTASLTKVGTTLLYSYTAASAAPSISGIDGALIFSTGGGESVSLGGGVAGAGIVNGAIVTNSLSFSTIEISGPGGGVETFSVLNTGLNVGEAFQLDSTIHAATFAGAVTATSVTASTAVDINGGTVTTSAGQTYNSAVTLSADTTLSDTGSSNITFASTVDSIAANHFGLTVNTAGVTAFQGDVGNTQALGFLATDNGGGGAEGTQIKGNIKTQSDLVVGHDAHITFGDNVTLTGATIITTTGGVAKTTFAGKLDGNFAATINGAAEFDATVGTTALASLDVKGATLLKANITTKTGGQTYEGAVTLGATETLTDTNGGGIIFKSTVDATTAGVQGLTTNTTGTTEFDAAVGATALASLDIKGAALLKDGSVTTKTGGQLYEGAVTLGGTETLTDTNGGAITFKSTVDATAAGVQGLTTNTTGTTEFDAAVGATALASLDIKGAALLKDGSVTTKTGGQLYEGAVTLGGTETLTDTNGGGITFKSTVNATTAGVQGLTTNTTGTTEFDATVGATALAALDVKGAALLKGNVTTKTGGQLYEGAVTLGATETLTDTNGGGITFKSTVDATTAGVQGLITNTTGTTEFDAAVGTTALASLDVKGPALLKGNITTKTGGQLYEGAVTLGGTETLTDTNGGGITFKSTVDATTAGVQGLTTNTTGMTEFDATVGATALASLDVKGPALLKANVTTKTGGQLYEGAVTLGGAITLSDTGGGGITFKSTLDATTAGAQSLVTNTTGVTEFDATVGTTALAAIDVGRALLKANVTTKAGGQLYRGAVTLGGTVILTDTNSGSIKFMSTVDATTAGVQGLTTNTTGTTEFDAAVGTTALAALDVKGPALVTADVTTKTGGQLYEGAVKLGGTVTLTDTGSGGITFNSTIDNATATARGLTTKTDGTADFKGFIGSGAFGGLASVTTGGVATNATGITKLEAGNVSTTVKTTGDQNYQNAVQLTANTTLVGANITFGSTLNSVPAGKNLTINSTGDVKFNGLSGNTGALGVVSATTSNNGATIAVNAKMIAGSVTLTSNGTGSQIDVNAPIDAAPIKLVSGAAGQDWFAIEATDAGFPIEVDALNGGNNIYISSAIAVNTSSRTATTATGNLASIKGIVNVVTTGADNGLVVSDSSSTVADNATIKNTTFAAGIANGVITGFGGAANINFSYQKSAPGLHPDLRVELDGANNPVGACNQFVYSVIAGGLTNFSGLDVAVAGGGGASSMSRFIINGAAETAPTTAVVMQAGAQQNALAVAPATHSITNPNALFNPVRTQYNPAVQFEARDVALLEMFGGASTGDWLENHTTLGTGGKASIPSLIAGGTGHDVLIGGKEQDVIFGGGVNQLIFSSTQVADAWFSSPSASIPIPNFAEKTDFFFPEIKFTFAQQGVSFPTVPGPGTGTKTFSATAGAVVSAIGSSIDPTRTNASATISFGGKTYTSSLSLSGPLNIIDYLKGVIKRGTVSTLTGTLSGAFQYLNSLVCGSIFKIN